MNDPAADCGDHDLKRRFARLRAEDLAGAPDFAQMVTRPGPRRGERAPLRLAAGLAAVAAVLGAAAAVTVWVGRAADSGNAAAGPEAVFPSWGTTGYAWATATDFLLDTPGRELLATVPRLGWGQGWYPVSEGSGGEAAAGGASAVRGNRP